MTSRRLGKLRTLLAIFCLSLMYRAYFEYTGAFELMRQLPGQMCFFVGGALIYYYFAFFEKNLHWILPASVAVTVIETWLHATVLFPLSLAAIVIYLACFVSAPKWLHPNWDLSYGVYIIHYPVLQTLVSFGWLTGNPAWDLAIAAAIIIVSACLSWNLIEKRFLTRRIVHKAGVTGAAARAY